MAWYSQNETPPEIEIDRRSLIAAFSNLLQRFDVYLTPTELHIVLTQEDPAIDWWSVAEYIDPIDMGEVLDDNSWPTSSNAIVRFRRLDVASAGYVDHYCLMADHRARAIIDSLDGKIKSATTYGEPTGWASYVLLPKDTPAEVAEQVDQPKLGTSHRVLSGGQNCWEIARAAKLDGINGADIAAHNDIDDASAIIPAGTEIRLPISQPKSTEKISEIELLDEPLELHVINPRGARKFAFGNVKKWTDITSTGPLYPEGTNVTITAIAHVPIPKDSTDAIFYMDALAVGDYPHNGVVSYMIGFNNAHLAQGHVERPKPKPKPIVVEKIREAEKVLEQAVQAVETTPELEVLPWKATIKPLREDRAAVTYLADETVDIYEMEGKRPAKPLYMNQGVQLKWTFWKDGIEYGLPQSHEKSGLWFGVPMDKVSIEDDIFDYALSNEDRIQVGKLTTIERYWYVPLAKIAAGYTKITRTFTKQK